MKCYENYVNGYGQALEILGNHGKSKKFRQVAETGKQQADQSLESLLVQPVQRIPRYVLLLRELLKHVEPGDPDHRPVTMALAAMEGLAGRINEKKREHEASQRLREIYGCIQNKDEFFRYQFIIPARRLVHEAPVLYRADVQKDVVDQTWYGILCTDLFLLTERKQHGARETFTVHHQIKLSKNFDVSSLEDGPEAELANRFLLADTTQSLFLGAETQADRDAWVSALTKCAELLKPTGNSKKPRKTRGSGRKRLNSKYCASGS